MADGGVPSRDEKRQEEVLLDVGVYVDSPSEAGPSEGLKRKSENDAGDGGSREGMNSEADKENQDPAPRRSKRRRA